MAISLVPADYEGDAGPRKGIARSMGLAGPRRAADYGRDRTGLAATCAGLVT